MGDRPRPRPVHNVVVLTQQLGQSKIRELGHEAQGLGRVTLRRGW